MTATQDEPPPAEEQDPLTRVARVRWERLRHAAQHGNLQPEGFALLAMIHERHPEWAKEWEQQ